MTVTYSKFRNVGVCEINLKKCDYQFVLIGTISLLLLQCLDIRFNPVGLKPIHFLLKRSFPPT